MNGPDDRFPLQNHERATQQRVALFVERISADDPTQAVEMIRSKQVQWFHRPYAGSEALLITTAVQTDCVEAVQAFIDQDVNCLSWIDNSTCLLHHCKSRKMVDCLAPHQLYIPMNRRSFITSVMNHQVRDGRLGYYMLKRFPALMIPRPQTGLAVFSTVQHESNLWMIHFRMAMVNMVSEDMVRHFW
jgi:hypothetical protein